MHNPKRFWSFVKCFKQSKGLSVLESGGAQVTDDIGKANLLNRTFASKLSDPAVTSFPDITFSITDKLYDFAMSEELVRLLQQLVVGKACGPDGLSARILRECAVELAVPLCKLFNMSLRHGIFPEQWAEANIVPIFKKGSRRDPDNYRSVSLLPLCAKVFEKIITDQIYTHVSPYLSPYQHGFIRNRSCATNLACFVAHGWTAIKEQAQLDSVYTDFSSAFQSVNHQLLLYKSDTCMYGPALRWLTYLGRRKQRVVVGGKVSDWVPAVSGTPEGGHMSALLFSLFVNDLTSVISTNCLMYADDLKIFCLVNSQQDVLRLQQDVDAVTNWAADWKLNLNASKCKSFKITLKKNFIKSSYTINGTVLENVGTIRDLGVVLDQKLTFSDHIDHIASKGNRALGLLIRTFQSASPRCKLNRQAIIASYNANVRSILEYCSVIWGGTARCHVVRIERVQHKFLMWLATHSEPSCTDLDYGRLLSFYNIRHLYARRAQSDIMFVCKLFKGFISSIHLLDCFAIHVPARTTRAASATLFSVPSAKSRWSRVNTVVNGLFVRGPQLINNLVQFSPQCDVFHDTLGQLKCNTVKFISTLQPVI